MIIYYITLMNNIGNIQIRSVCLEYAYILLEHSSKI